MEPAAASHYSNCKPDIDSQNSLAVITTGLADNPSCISDLDDLSEWIIYHVLDHGGDGEFSIGQHPIRQLIIGGPPVIAKSLNRLTPDDIDVTHNQMRFTQYLDDKKEEGGDYEIPSVRCNLPKFGYTVAQHGHVDHLNAQQFDVTDEWDQAKITQDVIQNIDAGRYRRAKQKAQSNRLQRIIEPFFEHTPDADHVLIIGDDKTSSSHVKRHAKHGNSKWTKYASSANGSVFSLVINTSRDDSPVCTTQAAELDPRFNADISSDDLNDHQKMKINQWLPSDMRKPMSDGESKAKMPS